MTLKCGRGRNRQVTHIKSNDGVHTLCGLTLIGRETMPNEKDVLLRGAKATCKKCTRIVPWRNRGSSAARARDR